MIFGMSVGWDRGKNSFVFWHAFDATCNNFHATCNYLFGVRHTRLNQIASHVHRSIYSENKSFIERYAPIRGYITAPFSSISISSAVRRETNFMHVQVFNSSMSYFPKIDVRTVWCLVPATLFFIYNHVAGVYH